MLVTITYFTVCWIYSITPQSESVYSVAFLTGVELFWELAVVCYLLFSRVTEKNRWWSKGWK